MSKDDYKATVQTSLLAAGGVARPQLADRIGDGAKPAEVPPAAARAGEGPEGFCRGLPSVHRRGAVRLLQLQDQDSRGRLGKVGEPMQ